MTKNNLQQHLSWLLSRGPSIPPSLPVTRTTSAISNSPNYNNILSVVLDRSADNHHILENDNGAQPPRNQVDDDGDILFADTDMAKLHLNPQPGTKPRMLTCMKNGVSSSPSTPSTRISQKNALKNDAAEDLKPALSGHNTRRETPVRRSPFNIKSPFSDIESIDLTGGPEPTTSSSGTVEAFSRPRRLPREDCASPAEATPRRGKKRKSDEYRSDLVSPLKDSPRICHAESPSKTRIIANNDNCEPFQSISKKSPKRKSPGQSPQKVKAGTPTKKKSSRPVIADSDDDEDVGLLAAHDVFDEPTFVSDADDLYPDLSKLEGATNRSTVLSPANLTKDSPKQAARKSPVRSRKGKAKEEEPPPQPSVQHSSIDGAIVERAKSESPIASTPTTTQKSRDSRVVKFLSLPSNAFEDVVAKLRQELTANAEVAYRHAIEGETAPPSLINRNKSLLGKINAFEELESQRSTYQTKLLKKEELKKLVIQTIEQGEGLDTIPAVVKESQSVEKQLREIEAKILDLLTVAQPKLMHGDSFDDQPEAAIKPVVEAPVMLGQTTLLAAQKNSETRVPSPQIWPRKSPSPPITDAVVQRTFEPKIPAQDFEDESMLMAVDDEPFTRNMGPPPSDPDDTDEFGIDDDDDDFLETTDQWNSQRRFAQVDHYLDQRKVLAETSGNANHAAASQKHLTAEQVAMMCHPWSKEVKTVMKDRFRLRGFRPNQLEAINATLSGKDAFVLMPTGGGKSLCYQLPAIVRSGRTKGVTLVVSPLLSLMQDQVAHLKALDIRAFLINGEVSAQQKRWITQTLAGPDSDEIEILYITPEMINLNQTLRNSLEILHKNGNLARIVIDEAHCVSQWGHDFRPDYKELGTVRARFLGVPVMALTATATQNVRVDVIHNLGMEGCEVFTQSFNRPNLTYEVLPKKGSMKEVTQSIVGIITGSYKNKVGIVYCLSRSDCEKVATHLCNFGIKAKHYHAGMKPEEKSQVQEQWQAGNFQVIVATIAFGMGIDKPDVRFVIHYSIPKSLEGYYQETGRAGRDGKRSGCYLFYGYKDSAVQKRLIEGGEGSWAQKDRQRQMLRNVVQFCENRTDCRRVQVLAYFNESFRREECHRTCDNCKSDATFELQDFTSYAKMAIELVMDFEERGEKTTLLHCVDIFAGHPKKNFPQEHKTHPLFGAGRDLELGEVERLFFRLLTEEALFEETKMFKNFATNYIKKGRKAQDYLHGRRSIQLPIRISPNGKKTSKSSSTGVRAAMEDHPQSTLVSSPIQSASRRKQARRKVDKSKDAPILSDDEDSEGFERIRVAGRPMRKKTHIPGPPITGDQAMKELDDLHLMVIEDFMTHAKAECHTIMMRKSLRAQPFTDSMLRQMAIQFPKDKAQLFEVKDIEKEKVELYGDHFLRLIQNSKQLYDDLKRQENERANDGVVDDPNHKTVIELDSSDDNYSSAEEMFNEPSNLDQVDDVRSRFFHNSPIRSYGPSTTAAGLSTQLTDLDARSVSPTGFSTTSRNRQARSGSTKRTFRRKASGAGPSSRQKAPSGSRVRSSGSGGNTTRAHSASTARKATNARSSASKKANSQPRIGMMPT